MTLYFSDRPKREAGHLTTEHFVGLWDEGENCFKVDPPNAVLSFLELDDSPPEDAVVTLSAPGLDGEVDHLHSERARRVDPGAGRALLAVYRHLRPAALTRIRRRRPAPRAPADALK